MPRCNIRIQTEENTNRPSQWYIRIIVAISILLVFAVGATVYRSFGTVENTPEIALVMKSLANEFFLTMEQEARRHQQQHGDYVLTTNGIRNESDINGQVRIVENMIARGVDALIIAPADSRALVSVCARAVSNGIIVVNIDNRLDQDLLQKRDTEIPFIGPNNRTGARSVGEYLAVHLEAGDPVAIIEGIPTAYNSQERVRGFREAFESASLEIVSIRSGEWDMEKANVITTSILNEHPGLRGIACANDSMALGAVAAIKAAGIQDAIYVVGFDNISAVQEMLATGQILATADQYAGRLAVFGIEYALDMLRTDVEPVDFETPVRLVTRETLE